MIAWLMFAGVVAVDVAALFGVVAVAWYGPAAIFEFVREITGGK